MQVLCVSHMAPAAWTTGSVGCVAAPRASIVGHLPGESVEDQPIRSPVPRWQRLVHGETSVAGYGSDGQPVSGSLAEDERTNSTGPVKLGLSLGCLGSS